MSLDEKILEIDEKFRDCPDLVKRKTYLKSGQEAYFIYLDGLIDTSLVQRDFINPILSMEDHEILKEETFHKLPVGKIWFYKDRNSLITAVLSGETVFTAEGMDFAVGCSLKNTDLNGVNEPDLEKALRGPRESFTETLSANLAMLRRKIRSSSLKFRLVEIGTVTHQKVAITYLEGVANPDLLKSIYQKIKALEFDGITDTGQIEQAIKDFPTSPFPQYQSTERPDRAVTALLEGRLAVILEGTPVVMLAPANYFAFFHAPDDFSVNWIYASLIRLVKISALTAVILLPALYIAITSFHYYIVPLKILISLAEARARAVFHPVVEVLMIEVILITLHELATRLATRIGVLIGIVGGVLFGLTALTTGFFNSFLLIIGAVSLMVSFLIPDYNYETLGILRFFFIVFAAVFGMLGIAVGSALTLAHLIILESIGQPYLQPFIPFKFPDSMYSVIKAPSRFLKKRPDLAKPQDR